MTRIEASARLHFGLLSVAADADTRQFGGMGLMLDQPRMIVRVKPAADWSSNHPRALAFARRFTESLPLDEQRPFATEIEQSLPEHAGLGSGTSLALAVAKAIATEQGHENWTSTQLAERIGRGERSAIGIHGFQQGGFIFEQGKRPGEIIAALTERIVFPADWRILLFQPLASSRWHGSREQKAFLQAHENPTEELLKLAIDRVLPALRSFDIDSFGEALYEYNRRAGQAFAAAQGGIYSSPAVESLVDRIRKQGVRGVGQSSWGPTVFTIVPNEEQAERLRQAMSGTFAGTIAITRATNSGAALVNDLETT